VWKKLYKYLRKIIKQCCYFFYKSALKIKTNGRMKSVMAQLPEINETFVIMQHTSTLHIEIPERASLHLQEPCLSVIYCFLCVVEAF
jgi:hypothetical protein